MRRIESSISSSQLCQRRKLFQILSQRLGWRAPERDTFATENFLWQHTGLPSEHHAFPDVCMFAHAHLATDNDIVFDGDAAGKSCLCRNDDVLADLAVVADVHQVVYLRAAANAGGLKRTAVNRCVGPDLDVVFDYQFPYLGE